MTFTPILIIDQLVLDFGFARFRINAIRINEGPLYRATTLKPCSDIMQSRLAR